MSSFGKMFKVSTYGESDGKSVGVIIEGAPSNFYIDLHDIQRQLNRRKPGYNHLTCVSSELDIVEIQSGVENGLALGTPICVIVKNTDVKAQDYQYLPNIKIPRPSQSDLSYLKKYKIFHSNGANANGANAKENIGRIIAGTIAERWLKVKYSIEIVAWVSQIGDIKFDIDDGGFLSKGILNRNIVDTYSTRCPNTGKSMEMDALLNKVKEQGDTVGGVISCVCRNVPCGVGEPCFDKLDAILAHAMMSISNAKGFEMGDAKNFVKNDAKNFAKNDAKNLVGGIEDGISTGSHINFNVAFKPANQTGNLIMRQNNSYGVNNLVPVVESMAALTIADAIIQQFGK